jgi:hypothetical protein
MAEHFQRVEWGRKISQSGSDFFNFGDKSLQIIDILWEKCGQSLDEFGAVARDIQGVGGHAHVIEAIGIVSIEGYFRIQLEFLEDAIDRLTLAAIPNIVKLSIKGVLFGHGKAVAKASWMLVGF